MDLGVIGRVGRVGSTHKIHYTNSKEARPLARLLMDDLGKEGTLRRVHPDVYVDECGPAGQCLLSALGLRHLVYWRPCDGATC